jgi:hypothetical protein
MAEVESSWIDNELQVGIQSRMHIGSILFCCSGGDGVMDWDWVMRVRGVCFRGFGLLVLLRWRAIVS